MLTEKKNEYFNIIFRDDEDHTGDYKHEFGRIMEEISGCAKLFEKCAFSRDFSTIMTGILLNESLTYLDKKDVKTVTFYKLKKLIKEIMAEEN